VSPDSRLIAVASPAYLLAQGRPEAPHDLRLHNCIRFRQTTGALHPWEFERDGEKVEVAVEGSLITNNLDLSVRAALEGTGISYMLEGYIASHLAEGRLIPLLENWSRPYAGYHLFYPSRRQMPAKLKALVEFLRGATRKALVPPRLVVPAMNGAAIATPAFPA